MPTYKKIPYYVILLLTGAMLFAGCTAIVKAAFGIREIESFEPADVESLFEECSQYGSCKTIVASTPQVDSMIRLDYDTVMMQHRAQPVQILYFDGDSLVFHHLSCFAQSGALSFDWNHHGYFDHFPPSPSPLYDGNRSMTLSGLAKIFPELNGQPRYTVVIFMCNVMRKVSKGAVSTVASNVTHRNDCNVVLINTDHWWADHMRNRRMRRGQ